MTPFDDALAFILAEEGGRVDDPRDPGGRTDHGVTQSTFDAWQRAHGQPTRDVWTITEAEVTALYRNAYFDPVRFDALPAGVGLCVVDDAVNSGVRESIVELQRAVGVTADGVLGALTMAEVAKSHPVAVIGRLCDGRMTFLRRLKAWITFGKGWSNRVAAVRTRALAMAAMSQNPAPAEAQNPARNMSGNITGAPVSVLPPKSGSVDPHGNQQPAPCTRPGCPLAAKAA